jgi:hypothetical protein
MYLPLIKTTEVVLAITLYAFPKTHFLDTTGSVSLVQNQFYQCILPKWTTIRTPVAQPMIKTLP